MFKYQIVEAERPDGSTVYILEQSMDGVNWTSVWRHEDLEEIRAAKKKREGGMDVKKRRVIPD